VDADNVASRRIAEQVISTTPEAFTEGNSGLPAFKYVRKIALFKPTQQHRPEWISGPRGEARARHREHAPSAQALNSRCALSFRSARVIGRNHSYRFTRIRINPAESLQFTRPAYGAAFPRAAAGAAFSARHDHRLDRACQGLCMSSGFLPKDQITHRPKKSAIVQRSVVNCRFQGLSRFPGLDRLENAGWR
jgi:hypothetical protein